MTQVNHLLFAVIASLAITQTAIAREPALLAHRGLVRHAPENTLPAFAAAVELGLSIELDVYQERLDGLMTAEVEFASEDESRAYSPPSWFGADVTADSRYKNKNLALHGAPQ